MRQGGLGKQENKLVNHFISVCSCEGIGQNVNTCGLSCMLKEQQKSFLNDFKMYLK